MILRKGKMKIRTHSHKEFSPPRPAPKKEMEWLEAKNDGFPVWNLFFWRLHSQGQLFVHWWCMEHIQNFGISIVGLYQQCPTQNLEATSNVPVRGATHPNSWMVHPNQMGVCLKMWNPPWKMCSNFRWNQQFLGNFERFHFQYFQPSFTSACKLRSTSSNRSTAICHFEDLSIALTAAWKCAKVCC